jgi:hypothetical protein
MGGIPNDPAAMALSTNDLVIQLQEVVGPETPEHTGLIQEAARRLLILQDLFTVTHAAVTVAGDCGLSPDTEV